MCLCVSSKKFLGYLVNRQWMKEYSKKQWAIIEVKAPTRPKEVQSLTGRIAALSRFVLISMDRCKPIFDVLKRGKKFQRSLECQSAFDELKLWLAQPPVLSKPKASETLVLYLVVFEHAISVVLARNAHGAQHPIHYVSKALHKAKLCYSTLEKLSYAMIIAARKLSILPRAHYRDSN